MDGRKLAALALALLGLATLAWGASRGDVRILWVLFFPVVIGTGPVPFLAIGAIVAALFLGTFARGREMVETTPLAHRAEPPPSRPSAPTPRGGGIVFIGPIPIVWGSDRGITRTLLWLALALTLLLAAFYLLAPRLARADPVNL